VTAGALFVRANGRTAEVTLHRTAGGFPANECIATPRGYAALDEPGVEFDSGLRVTLTNGKVKQVCAGLTGNLLLTRLPADNALFVMDDLDAAYAGLTKLLGRGRVGLGNGGVLRVTAPPTRSMITKLLIFGRGIRLELDNNVTLESSKNGWNMSPVGGDRQRLGRVLLLGMIPGRRFTMSVDTDAWKNDDAVHAGIALGYAVEALPKAVTSLEPVCSAPSWCMYKRGAGFTYVHSDEELMPTWQAARELILYKGGSKRCSYFSMGDVTAV